MKQLTMVLWGLLAMSITVFVGCHSADSVNKDTASDSSDADSDTDTDTDTDTGIRELKNHREVATSCQNDFSPIEPSEDADGSCSQDADCTEGMNGKCIRGIGMAGLIFNCTYDLCVADEDCSNSEICHCSST